MKIVVGISGGIAAYKAVGVVRAFVLAGHDVHVVPTAAALRFVGKPTLEAISRNQVESDLYEGVAEVRHVALGQTADLIVVAPATANTIARLAAGLADDLLGTTVLASGAPLVLAPAMHSEMWENAATRANVALLESRGVRMVGPTSGQLTGKDSGPGRMAEPADIVEAALDAVLAANVPASTAVTPLRGAPEPAGVGPDLDRAGRPRTQRFAGRRVVVTAGGTREPLDPVRFLGNRSSGRQGVALAEAARDLGAEVTLVAAHLEVAEPGGVTVVHAGTAEELLAATTVAARDADLLIMCAAVADFRPAEAVDHKLKKRDTGQRLTLELVQNPDVLRALVAQRAERGPADQVLVGFAAETEQDPERLLTLGREKIAAKGCDYLVLNEVGWGTGFGSGDTAVTVLDAAGDSVGTARGDKVSVALSILDLVARD